MSKHPNDFVAGLAAACLALAALHPASAGDVEWNQYVPPDPECMTRVRERLARDRLFDPAANACKPTPKLLRDVPWPIYPAAAIERRLEGACKATFDILADGRVDEATIAVNCTDEVFAMTTRETIARWRFAWADGGIEPETRRSVRRTFDFVMQDAEAEP